MKILVAGGAGFIGSHLVDKLLNCGYEIVCADKLVFGEKNVHHLDKCEKYKFYNMDLAIQENVNLIFSENKIDAVYHMAANSDIQKGGRKPDIDFNDTFLTTRALLEGMRKNNVKNLFFASTSAVYGEMQEITTLKETTGGIKPISYYGGAKLASEAIISSYTHMCDMSVMVFRFPNVIGPRLTHGVVYDFINKLHVNPYELEILGDGTQCKPYIYVSDLIDAIYFLTKEWKKGEEIYNLGVMGEGTTVTRIAGIVTEEMGLKNVRFKYTGGNRGWKGDVPVFKYDISKVLSTGWNPKYTSDEAVRQAVKYALGNAI